ncbi:hypothetical protein BC826DRAFT_1107084 [Russula brevipes]|nr:hypothetical protein BC826DRAFT_1107084 [Russula brevipes]
MNRRNAQTPLAVGLGAMAGLLLTPVILPVAVSAIGFGAAGPIAGSVAAVWQASIGNVAAGSLFAVAQSIGMGGAISSIVTAIGASVGAASAAAAAGTASTSSGEDAASDDEDTASDGSGDATTQG